MQYEPVLRMVLGYGKRLFLIIIVVRVPVCLLCEVDEFRGGLKGNFVVMVDPMYIFILVIRDVNPR